MHVQQPARVGVRKVDVSTRSEFAFVATTFAPSRTGAVEKPRWLMHMR